MTTHTNTLAPDQDNRGGADRPLACGTQGFRCGGCQACKLDAALPQVDYLTQHGLRLMQEPRDFAPTDSRSISYTRAQGEVSSAGHLVWVLGHKGQVRLYALVGGVLRFTNPDYAGEWPELNAAVAARLGAKLFTDVTWRSNGPIENWRLA